MLDHRGRWKPSGEEQQGVWEVQAVPCPGQRHFQADADNHGQRSGLIHTEEVTGSIPVMPTQLSGQSRSCSWPFVILVQLRAAAGSEGLRPELVHQAGLEAVVSSLPADCDQSRMLSGFPTTYMPHTSI